MILGNSPRIKNNVLQRRPILKIGNIGICAMKTRNLLHHSRSHPHFVCIKHSAQDHQPCLHKRCCLPASIQCFSTMLQSHFVQKGRSRRSYLLHCALDNSKLITRETWLKSNQNKLIRSLLIMRGMIGKHWKF